MKNTKHVVVLLIAFSMLLAIPVLASTENEYSDVLTDGEGDVFHWHGTGWDYDVERPNVDIIRGEIEKSGGTITISMTVKGEITDLSEIYYYGYLEDEGDSSMYYYLYSNGSISMSVSNEQGYRYFEPDIAGVGTDTLTVSCSLEDLLNPDSLQFSSLITYEYTEDGWYQDTADPEDAEFLPIDFELDVEPIIGEAPLEVDITFSAENTGDANGEIPVTVDGEPIYVMELGAQEWNEDYITHTFYDAGTYFVEFGDQSVTVYVEGDSDDDEQIGEPYSDVVTDPEGDVMRLVGPGDDDWEYGESPDVDITRVEISESGGVITVSMRVKGTIKDHSDVYYEIFLKDNTDDSFFEIHYTDDEVGMSVYTGTFGSHFEPAVNGVGTETLSFSFNREQIGNPDILEISWATAINEEYPEADMAGPDAEYPDNDGSLPPDDDDDDFDDDDFEIPIDIPFDEIHEKIGRANGAGASGVATFMKAEGYDRWASLVINAEDANGVESVTIEFKDEKLVIEVTDEKEDNYVTILVNKNFVDEHISNSEGNLNIETSSGAVVYQGLDESHPSAGGGAVYVFQIEHFSTHNIEISSAEDDIEEIEGFLADLVARGMMILAMIILLPIVIVIILVVVVFKVLKKDDEGHQVQPLEPRSHPPEQPPENQPPEEGQEQRENTPPPQGSN